MTAQLKRVLLTLASGSALAIAPFAVGTVLVPATSQADQCADAAQAGTPSDQPCGTQAKGLTCPDGTIVDDKNKKCVDLMAGISKQLRALPPPPSLAGAGGGGGIGSLGSLGGIPSLGTVNMPDLVLPSLGLNLVPDVNLNLQPRIGGVSAPAATLPAAPSLASLPAPQVPPALDLAKLPAPKLPPPPKIDPLNPLGLPPPPDLTPGIPFI